MGVVEGRGIKRRAFNHYRGQRDVFGALIPLNSNSGTPAIEQETDGNKDSDNDVDREGDDVV